MYLGNQPALSYTSFAKQDFTTSATTSYTLDNPVANENEIALFINFVRQEPTTAYTASGTSLTLTSATSASDDMYAIFLGKAVQTVNPPAGSVGASQIADGSIALGKLSATGTKDSTTFLRGDNTFSTITSGLTEVDIWRVTTDISLSSTDTDISSNWERADTFGSTVLGTGMTESSGIFTFPSTGYYLITAHTSGHNPSSTSQYVSVDIHATTDNSTYSTASVGRSSVGQSSYHFGTYCQFIFKVTSTTNCKIKLRGNAQHSSTSVFGNTNLFSNSLMFIKLGDI